MESRLRVLRAYGSRPALVEMIEAGARAITAEDWAPAGCHRLLPGRGRRGRAGDDFTPARLNERDSRDSLKSIGDRCASTLLHTRGRAGMRPTS